MTSPAVPCDDAPAQADCRGNVNVTVPSPPPSTNTTALGKTLSVVDFVIRLAFFIVAPVVVFFLAMVLPLTGAVINVALLLLVVLLGDRIRTHADRLSFLKVILRRQLAMDEYYQTHRPKPFLYYVFFPLLLPFWLFHPVRRREFTLFRGLSGVALILTLVPKILEYPMKWAPEIPVTHYLKTAAAAFVLELMVTMMFLMPMVTTVVHYRLAGQRKRLNALLYAALFVLVPLFVGTFTARGKFVPIVVRVRMQERTYAAPARATTTTQMALVTVAKLAKPSDLELGEIRGRAREAGLAVLSTFYRDDEARLFRFWLVQHPSADGSRRMIVTFAGSQQRARPVWLALDDKGNFVNDPKRIPAYAVHLMQSRSKME